jgi:hypothetical protein
MKNAVFCNVAPCGSCENRASGKEIATVFRVEKYASEEKRFFELWLSASQLQTLNII